MTDALQRVVGVDEEDAVVGQGFGVGGEGLGLVRERHHPAVRVGALDRNPEAHPGEHVRGRGAATDVRGATGSERTVGALGPAQAEFEDGLPLRGDRHARGLGRDEGVEVDQAQQRGLEQLALDDRPAHADQGLVRKDHGPFRDGVDVRGQAQGAEVIEEGALEERLAVVAGQGREVAERSGFEAEIVQPVDDRLQSAGHRIAALERQLAEGQTEHRLALGATGAPVGVGHGQLVEVGQ